MIRSNSRKRMDYLSFLKVTRIIREVNKCWENSPKNWRI